MAKKKMQIEELRSMIKKMEEELNLQLLEEQQKIGAYVQQVTGKTSLDEIIGTFKICEIDEGDNIQDEPRNDEGKDPKTDR